MFTIPLYSLLILYGLFLVVFAIFLLINFFHLNHTASLTPVSIAVTLIVLSTSVAIIIGTLALLQDVEWRSPLIQFNSNPFQSFSPTS